MDGVNFCGIPTFRLWETVLGSVKITSGGSLQDVEREGTKRESGARAQQGDWVGNMTLHKKRCSFNGPMPRLKKGPLGHMTLLIQ